MHVIVVELNIDVFLYSTRWVRIFILCALKLLEKRTTRISQMSFEDFFGERSLGLKFDLRFNQVAC